MSYLFLFHGNSGYVNVPQCYIIYTLPVLFQYGTIKTWKFMIADAQEVPINLTVCQIHTEF